MGDELTLTIMTKKANKLNWKFLKNNWVITVSATLIGVFIALYLNEMVSSIKLNNQKSIATKNLFQEIENNRKSIEENIEKHEVMLAVFEFRSNHVDAENRVITTPDSMQLFKNKYPGVLEIKDSTKMGDGRFHYQGEVNVNFNFSYLNLTNLVWETIKSSGLIISYDFNCLVYLEKMDKLTVELLNQEKRVFHVLANRDNYPDNRDYYNQLHMELKLLLGYENTLLGSYKASITELESCR